MLREFVPGQVWFAEVPFQRLGFNVGARMTVLALPDGSLFVHSPIGLTEELRRDVDALGPVRHLVAPSGMHYLHLAEWVEAYPEAQPYLAPALRDKVKLPRKPEILTATAPAAWSEVMEQVPVLGNSLYDEVDFFHRPSRSLILTDLCFNIPESSKGTTRMWAAALGILGGLSSSRSFIVTIRDRPAARATIERILEWDFDRVIISHGDPVAQDGKAEFRRAYSWLLRERG